jgi:hypothetical protein
MYLCVVYAVCAADYVCAVGSVRAVGSVCAVCAAPTDVTYAIYFPENRAVYEIMWENIVERGRLQMAI